MKVVQGIYEHYKSTPQKPRYYQVLFLSHNEGTLERLVHYVPLYLDNSNKVYDDGITIWTRTLSDFCEDVELDGKVVPRFKLIDKLDA